MSRRKGTKSNQSLGEGELADHSHSRLFPKTGLIDLKPQQVRGKIVEMYIVENEPNYQMKNSDFNDVFFYHVSHFYVPPEEGPAINNYRLISEYVALLIHMVDPSSALRDANLAKECKKAGVLIDGVVVNSERFKQVKTNSHHYNYLRGVMNDSWKDMRKDMSASLCMASVILLTTFKSINPINKDGYIKNRIRAFSGTLGSKLGNEVWDDSNYPDTTCLENLYNVMSSNFHLRKAIFTTLYSIAYQDIRNPFVKVCQEIVQLIKCTEMHHFVLIDQYLYKDYSELRKLSCLSGLDKSMKKARNILCQMTREEMFFVKILKDKNETSDLNRAHFKVATAIATACARFDEDSMKNYFSPESETLGELINMVDQYLQLRRSGSLIQAGSGATMPELESQEYFERIMINYKIDITGIMDPDDNKTIAPPPLRAQIPLLTPM